MDNLIQSAPFMPPISDTTKCQIFLLGDLTLDFEPDLRQLLHVKDNANLQSFFDNVSIAFRQEFAALPLAEQDWLPRFTTLIDLVANLNGTEGAPALRVALLCIYQLGRFIRYDCLGASSSESARLMFLSFFAEGSRPYPSASNTYLLGLCAGSFATAAIATSQTITELIPAGVESVLVAFRAGFRSLKLRHDLEKPNSEVSRSWSVAVSLSEVQATELLESFSTAKVSISSA